LYDKATEIKVIHRNSEFYGASEYDKKELHRFLSSTDKIIVKACIEKYPLSIYYQLYTNHININKETLIKLCSFLFSSIVNPCLGLILKAQVFL